MALCNFPLTTLGYDEYEIQMTVHTMEFALDIETRRKKQQALMVQMVERKVRSRAQQLYETRGLADGQDLQDWFQAESEVLENSILAPLYRRLRHDNSDLQRSDLQKDNSAEISNESPANCEAV